MTTSKSLPPRPSLDSLRKQAKKLARQIALGDAAAIARVRMQAPDIDLPITQRNAQLVIAREYGFAGWQDLTAEVSRRLGSAFEWATEQAWRIIHDNDVDRLKQLIAEYPGLLSWHGDEDGSGILGFATGAYGDAGDPGREQSFTRAGCAELLIDAGAIVMPSVCEGIVRSRARGLLHLFQRKALLPRTLKFLAALDDVDGVRTVLSENGNDLATVNEAFMCACGFEYEAVASLLLERSIALDPVLGRHVEEIGGRSAFIRSIGENRSHYFAQPRIDGAEHPIPDGPWQVYLLQQVKRAVHDRDLPSFVQWLRREPWLLGDGCEGFQVGLIGQATLQDRGEFIGALIEANPAILRRQPPPPSQAIEFAMTYGKTHLIPILTRIWPLPDDLPHAAGMGDLDRVKRWFDADGKPALGDVANHQPATSTHPRERQWGAVGVQQVLDTALAWAVINHHFDVADFLLAHGADVNTNWNSHEPASILHHLVFLDDYEAMKFLIDRGIDMTIEDYRWNGTAQGWAYYGKNDPKMAEWLEEAEKQRAVRKRTF